jgi:hypothetical protein
MPSTQMREYLRAAGWTDAGVEIMFGKRTNQAE